MEVKQFRTLCMSLFLLIAYSVIRADQVGSNTLPSVVDYTSFGTPLITQNNMLAFGWMKNGFGMDDSTMSCTFQSAFPVSGHLSLHGGQLTLGTDMKLANPILFASPGIIHGDNHIFDIAQTVTALPSTARSIFKNTKICFNGDLNITGTVDLKGNCLIDGFAHRLILGANGVLKVGHNSTLTLKNVELDGIKNYNICCMDDSASIILDNVRWVQTGDYTFSRGSIAFQNETDFVGPFRFFYTSSLTSTVKADSMWFCSDLVELTIGRATGINGREPLYFEDETAFFKLENSSLNITSSGMRFTRGTFLCDRQVSLNVNSTGLINGVELGDGNIANDVTFKLLPAATFKLSGGHLIYNVVDAENFLTDDVAVKFYRAGTSVFHSKQNIDFVNVTIRGDLTSQVSLDPGVVFTYDNVNYKYSFAEFRLTGARYALFTDLLRGGEDKLELVSGVYPFNLHVKSFGSQLLGSGGISGQIRLHDPYSYLIYNLDGMISSNIVMNGGNLILAHDLAFAQDVMPTGTGNIVLNSYRTIFGLVDLNITSSLSWDALGGSVVLQNPASLSSEWVFSGNCVLDAGGNELKLHPTAKIKVASGSTLKLKNVFLSGVQGAKIECTDDSSSIILDNVRWVQDGNFSFTRGNLNIVNNVDFLGSYTFFYQTGLTSTISQHSRWSFGGDITLVIGRKNGIDDREPLYFENSTSQLGADLVTFVVTSSGMRLTRGMMDVGNYLTLDLDSTFSKNGLQMGDCTQAGDFVFQFGPGSTLRFKKGHFTYSNTEPTSVKALTKLSKVIIDPNFTIYTEKSLKVKNLSLEFAALWDAIVSPGATLEYEDAAFSVPGSEVVLSGQRYSQTASLLNNNQKLIALTGIAPLGTLVLGAGNVISGAGSIGADVVLLSPASQLIWDVGGLMLADLSLGGGTVDLTKPLVFADNKSPVQTGKINLSSYYMELGGLDLSATGSIYFDSNRASLVLRSNLHLTSRWTFSGDCTILGNGNAITFGPSGKIAVERGSQLRFKDVTLNGLLDGQVYCIDNAGEIIFDTSTWIQDTNFSFTLGRFQVENELIMMGRDRQFSYRSDRRSVLRDRSNWYLKDDFIFSYEPTSTDRGLIVLADTTSRMIMKNSTLHSTSTGLQLTRGYLEVHGQCYLDSDASVKAEGITFGDGAAEGQDLKVDIYPESNLELISGFLVYKNLA